MNNNIKSKWMEFNQFVQKEKKVKKYSIEYNNW